MPLGATENEVKIAAAKALKIKEENIATFLIINKVDKVKKDELYNMIMEYKDKYDFKEELYGKEGTIGAFPMAVLVNGYSASASEILAGAVKDTGRGTLVGMQTFGKGLVQRLFTLPDGSGLNVTIQKYYTPKGTSIHGIGVQPDEVVQLPEKYLATGLADIPEAEDTQLQKAAEVLRENN